jgi:hypothetical protein
MRNGQIDGSTMKSRKAVRIVDNCLSVDAEVGEDYFAVAVVAIELQGKVEIAECSAYRIVIADSCSYAILAALLTSGYSAIDGDTRCACQRAEAGDGYPKGWAW